MTRKFVSVAEFAETTGSPKSTVYDSVRLGRLKSIRLGGDRGSIRIPATEIDRLLEEAS